MANSAWCGLNSKGDILKKHDICPNSKCKCQKQLTFNKKQFELEGAGFKKRLQSFFKGTQIPCNEFVKSAINAAAPVIGMALAAKSWKPAMGQTTTNTLQSISDGKFSSLTDMYANGLRLKVMWVKLKQDGRLAPAYFSPNYIFWSTFSNGYKQNNCLDISFQRVFTNISSTTDFCTLCKMVSRLSI